jgi:hypothetical protein
LYELPNIIRVIKSRRMRGVRHTASMGEVRNAFKILVGKPEGKRPLGRCRHRWEVGWEGVDWVHLTPDRDQW